MPREAPSATNIRWCTTQVSSYSVLKNTKFVGKLELSFNSVFLAVPYWYKLTSFDIFSNKIIRLCVFLLYSAGKQPAVAGERPAEAAAQPQARAGLPPWMTSHINGWSASSPCISVLTSMSSKLHRPAWCIFIAILWLLASWPLEERKKRRKFS